MAHGLPRLAYWGVHIRGSLVVDYNQWRKLTWLAENNLFYLAVISLSTTLVMRIEQLVGCVCLSMCLKIPFELSDLWPRYLACWFNLTLSSSFTKVKVKVLSHMRKMLLKRYGDDHRLCHLTRFVSHLSQYRVVIVTAPAAHVLLNGFIYLLTYIHISLGLAALKKGSWMRHEFHMIVQIAKCQTPHFFINHSNSMFTCTEKKIPFCFLVCL